MCDFKLCILLEFKKEMSKHAKRHLFVWFYSVLARKIECLAMPFAKI